MPPIKIEFKRMPWKRCKAELKKGKVDGIFNASFKVKRMKLGVYPMKNGHPDESKRITYISYVLYALNTSPIEWDEKNKKIYGINSKICAPMGYSIVDDFKKWEIPVYERYTTHDCLKSLIINFNRVSGVAALELAGDYYLRIYSEKFKNIIKISPPIVKKAYYLMLSHQFNNKASHISKKIWDTISEIRETEFDNTLKKYFKSSH